MDILAHPRRLSSSSSHQHQHHQQLQSTEMPASMLFSSPPHVHRSPKGPRPAPSTFHGYGALELIRAPVPVDVDEDGEEEILIPTNNTNNDDILQDIYDSYEPRNPSSLFSASSASPPPFARNMSSSASIPFTSSSSSITSPECQSHQSNADVASQDPDPWFEQTTFTQNDLIATRSNPITPDPIHQNERPPSIGPITQSLLRNALESSSTSIIDGSDLTSSQKQVDPVSPPSSGDAQKLSNSVCVGTECSNDEAQTVQSASNALENLTLGTEENVKPSTSPKTPAPVQIPVSASTLESTARSAPPSSSISSPNSTPNSYSKSPNNNFFTTTTMPGSYGTSSMLAESTTWEKVDVTDEWTELSNPREDVVVISDDENESDEDDEEWEESRKVKGGVADSVFLPTLERKRREAAKATGKKYTENGSITPRGRRTPTNSFAQNGGRCGYEAYQTTTRPPNTTSSTQSPPSQKLTPQQEQIVAELQRARTSKGVGVSPIAVPVRHTVSLSSDW